MRSEAWPVGALAEGDGKEAGLEEIRVSMAPGTQASSWPAEAHSPGAVPCVLLSLGVLI